MTKLRASFYTAELVHNFDGDWETDVTIEIGLHNATAYFPSSLLDSAGFVAAAGGLPSKHEHGSGRSLSSRPHIFLGAIE